VLILLKLAPRTSEIDGICGLNCGIEILGHG